MTKGLVIVNTGDGKGKTTAALGVIFRAWGRGMKVCMVQFLKHEAGNWGEVRAAQKLGIEWIKTGDGFTWTSKDLDETTAKALHGWEIAKTKITGDYDLVVLDEFTYVMSLGWLNAAEVVAWLQAHKPPTQHLIITGRSAPPELVEYADLVTDMTKVKHPYDLGITAQPGIEFLTFRLGSTSYVYPGDLVYNVERLAGTVRDVELVLFHTDTVTNYPNADTVSRLTELAAAHDLTYTVHLPFDLRHDDPHAHEHAARVIDLTAPLKPYAWVFHLADAGVGQPGWAEDGIRVVERLLPLVDDPARLALENLETYPSHLLDPVFAALPIRRALDIGHLWKAGLDPLPVLAAWLPTTEVVHLHGAALMEGRIADHLSLTVTPPDVLDTVLSPLLRWGGVLTLEVFEGDFFTSHAAVVESLRRLRV